jgi:hypothetical protein
LWNADPSQDEAGTITLTTTSGTTTDLVAQGAIQSGEIGAYLQVRDSILPQAQNQLDELANQMSQALSNQSTSGTAATSGSQTGYSVDVGGLQLTYTDSSNTQHTVTVVTLGSGGTLPAGTSSSANNQVIVIDFSGGMSSVVAQLNAKLGTSVQFSNPSATVLQALNRSGSGTTVNSLSATTTATSFTSGGGALPLFLDGGQPITGALTSAGSQTTGLAGRITVNPALVASLHAHGVRQLGQEFADFSDTAAVIALLDLVVAVDTSVAHLAGAMGKGVALLIPFSPDWRWLLHRTDSLWYPTMRIFRQDAVGDWEGPLGRLRHELSDVVRRGARRR